MQCNNNDVVTTYGANVYFNQGSCVDFPEGSGGCSGNNNAFYSNSSCKMTCVCSLPAEPGSGQSPETAYFYNTTRYTAISVTVDVIMGVCFLMTLVVWCAFNNALAQNSACSAQPEQRTCESNDDKERWFFNSTKGACDSFDWETCTQGDNSFSSWLDCTHACVCQLPADPMQCNNNDVVTTYGANVYFNQGSCVDFPEGSGGCSGNDNAFNSNSSCKMTCVCSLPAESGSGEGQDTAYFFNTTSHSCEQFTYTGEGGNANRFESLDQCKDQCLCGMPKAPADGESTCYAYMPSVFYNSSSGQCEDFIYGGCRGNNNRFGSTSECEAACP